MFTRSFIKSGLIAAAALACLFSLGLPGGAHAGPVFSSETPRLGLSRTAQANSAAVQPANIGNPAPAAGTEKRVALVIGNSAYENVTALPNPANDAKAIGKFLNSAGFEVIQATDLDHDEMIQVLQDFSARISERGPDTVAFVYYAGHGVQIAGENYLVPVDARIGSEADVPNAAIRLVDVMATLQAVPSRMRIVLLDACRNNPFSQLKDAGRGLAIVDAPNGSIVGYSTAPGTEAFDGDGANSPYTTAFLRVAGEQNLPIERVFKQVRVAVNEATDGKQTPWESSSLTSDFYFFGDTVMAAARNIDRVASANASASASETRSAVASNVRTRNPRDAYKYVVAEDSVASYEEFVRAYPQDPFADRVRKLLASKLLALAWHGAVAANSPPAYKAFYSQYSDSPYASLAMRLESQPKLMPLYQPTKIMVAPQLAPRIRLSNFNGVSIPQGDSAPIGLGGRGSLFNKGFAKGQPLPAPAMNAGGMMPNGPAKSPMPGIDLAKGGKRFDTRIDGGRLSTLPSSGPKAVMNGPGAGPIGRDAKVMDRRVHGRPQAGPQVGDKRFEPSRDRPANRIRNRPVFDRQPAANRVQPAARMQMNGSTGAGRKAVWSSPKPMSFGGNGGGGGNSGGRFAGGGFGRSFR